MPLFEAEGIVLKTYELADADKIAVIFTREQGIVRGIARGVKRLKSRFGSGLEFLTIIKISYFQKEQQELVSIREIEISKSYFDLLKDDNILNQTAYLSQLLIDFMPAQQSDENVYRLVKSCLDTAAENAESLDLLILYFELWLLRLGGFLPDWQKCFQCLKIFSNYQPANLHYNNHLICRDCQPKRNNFEISPEQRQVVNLIQKLSPENFLSVFNQGTFDISGLTAIFRKQINEILGRNTNQNSFSTNS